MSQELNSKSPLGKIFRFENVYLNLLLPAEIHFRAQILCEDVEALTEERFRLDDLISMLWKDFINYARKTVDIKAIYKLLLEFDQGTSNVRVKNYNEEKEEVLPLYPIRKRTETDIEKVYCKMDRKLALRGEVLLSDIANLYPSHPLTVERVLEILIIDFIEKYRTGEARDLIKIYIERPS
ncbi:hypothetical protein [Evansella vedderi]|nr:hypothetical protein [Evansella vedderi]